MSDQISLKSPEDVKNLRISGGILGVVLQELKQMARTGVLPTDLDKKAREIIKTHGGTPAFIGYRSREKARAYPSAICTSINEKIVHCVPNRKPLVNGDVLKIDSGVNYRGLITDAAITVGVGNISEMAEKLIKAARTALYEAINICRPGKRLGDIGWIIEHTVSQYGFSVVEKLTGHGVGFELHEPPNVFNRGNRRSGIKLQPGMVIAIEPMVSAGSPEILEDKSGEIAMKDGSLSAHFEMTVAILKNGKEVLTPLPD